MPLSSEKVSHGLFPVDDISVPETFFEESGSQLNSNSFYHAQKNSWHTAGIEQFYKLNTLPLK